MSSLCNPNIISNPLDQVVSTARTIQNISGRYINQGKLETMLRMKFGVGAYDLYASFISVFDV